MLTVLDADIDLGALLDAAEGAVPALEAANRVVALIEPDGAAHVVDERRIDLDSSQSRSSSDGDGNAGSSDPPDVDPDETIEEKRHRMSDLLQRLGLNHPDRQQDFRIYAHVTYGKGWSERASDIDKMNACLATALAKPDDLDAEIGKALQTASPA